MREIISLNENWTLSFPKGERPTEQVTLPHTWNAVDGMDGNGSYLRTTGVYTRTFTQPKQPLAGGRTYVEVLAAALAATVKVNGQVATTHEGGLLHLPCRCHRPVPRGRQRADHRGLQRGHPLHVPRFRRLHLLRRPVPRREPDQRARHPL